MPPSEHGRPAQAKGVGKNAKRHDLERRDTPYMHGNNDIQQGDIKQMQQGQAIAGTPGRNPRPPAGNPRTGQGPAGPAPQLGNEEIPDPITFFGQLDAQIPQGQYQLTNEIQVEKFYPLMEQVAGRGQSSSLLRSLFLRQMRNVMFAQPHVAEVNINDIDDSLLEG